MTIKLSPRSQQVELYLAIEGSGLAFPNTDLGHFFRINVSDEFGVILTGKGLHKPEFAYNISIHSLMIYTDLPECKIADDTKPPCCTASFYFQVKSRVLYNHWTVQEL